MKAAVVVHQLGNLISNRSILENLKIELKNLQDQKKRVQVNLTLHYEKLQTQREWLKRVDEILGQGERFLAYYEGKSTCTNFLLRYKVGKQSRKMQQIILQLIEEGNSHLSAARDYERPKSRDDTIEDIMKALKDPSIQAVGVWGLGGIGTTPLAKHIREKAEEQKLFTAVVGITVTDKSNHEQVQKAIADELGVQLTNGESLVKRRNKLRQRIKKEQNCLIIIDDTWGELDPQEFDLEEFGVPPGNEHAGCKLLLTSGNMNFIQNLKGASKLKVVQLEALQKEEAQMLFQKMVGGVVEDQASSIVEEIVRSCEGSTSLIYAIAKALEKKGIDALMQLKENISPTNLLSFCLEENEELKSLLLLLTIRGRRFINIYSIYIDMWAGVFKNLETADSARKKRDSLISDLKAYGLVVENGKDWVGVDDYIWHTANRMAQQDRRRASMISREWPSEEGLKDLHFCNIHLVSDLQVPERLQCPNLKHLLISRENPTIDVPDSFFEETKLLKVLDFVSFSRPNLPISFVSLKDLEALSMYQCNFRDIAKVCELTNLRMLGLLESRIQQLPVQIGQLQKLLFLDLRDTYLQVIPPNVLSNLTSLEELYLRNSFCNWKIEMSSTENNASLKELTDLEHLAYIEDLYVPDPQAWPVEMFFRNLRSYTIFIGDGWSRQHDGDHEFKTLKLNLNRRFQSDDGIKKMLKEVQVLHLNTLTGVQNVLNDLECDGFPQLQSLFIQNNDELKCIATGSGNDPLDAFPNLESLSLSILSNLKHICHGGPLTEKSFFKLRVITVEKCSEMGCLFSKSMINGLPHLATLNVSQCKSIKAIVLIEGAENPPIEFPELCSLTLQGLPALISFCSSEGSSSTDTPTLFHDKVSCPNLETMVIFEVSELTTIWNEGYNAENSFWKLKNVNIKYCEKLRTVFPVNLSKNLDNLKMLEVTNCSSMTSIFTVMKQDSSIPGIQLSIPMIQINLTNLPKLEYVCVTEGFESLKKRFEEEWHAGLPGLSANARIEHQRKMKFFLEEYLHM